MFATNSILHGNPSAIYQWQVAITGLRLKIRHWPLYTSYCFWSWSPRLGGLLTWISRGHKPLRLPTYQLMFRHKSVDHVWFAHPSAGKDDQYQQEVSITIRKMMVIKWWLMMVTDADYWWWLQMMFKYWWLCYWYHYSCWSKLTIRPNQLVINQTTWTNHNNQLRVTMTNINHLPTYLPTYLANVVDWSSHQP